jgi:hypothetical protein
MEQRHLPTESLEEQNLMNYPAMTTGLVTVPRGFGSMAAMFFIARVRLSSLIPGLG